MSKPSNNMSERAEVSALPVGALESGVINKSLLEGVDLDRAPPWSVVDRYLATGEGRAWVEGFALRSPAFADVLEALRNDEEERLAARPDAVVIPFRR